jgi:hypothetical protein
MACVFSCNPLATQMPQRVLSPLLMVDRKRRACDLPRTGPRTGLAASADGRSRRIGNLHPSPAGPSTSSGQPPSASWPSALDDAQGRPFDDAQGRHTTTRGITQPTSSISAALRQAALLGRVALGDRIGEGECQRIAASRDSIRRIPDRCGGPGMDVLQQCQVRRDQGYPYRRTALASSTRLYWTTISTRRFCGSRTLSPVGTSSWVSPLPMTVIACAGTPSRTRASLTALARRSDSAML